jgi:hypothetical protein
MFHNNLSFRTNPEGGVPDFISGNVDETNFFFDGEQSVNSNGVVVHSSDFVSLDMPQQYTRDAEGNIIWSDFLRLEINSPLNHAGTNGKHVGALPTVLEAVKALIEFRPPVLNLKGLENRPESDSNQPAPLVTVYIQLQEGFHLEDIVFDTIRLNGVLQPVTGPEGDVNSPIVEEGGKLKYMVKFSRHDLATILPEAGEVPIMIEGTLQNGRPFMGVTFITVRR